MLRTDSAGQPRRATRRRLNRATHPFLAQAFSDRITDPRIDLLFDGRTRPVPIRKKPVFARHDIDPVAIGVQENMCALWLDLANDAALRLRSLRLSLLCLRCGSDALGSSSDDAATRAAAQPVDGSGKHGRVGYKFEPHPGRVEQIAGAVATVAGIDDRPS